MPPSPRHAYTRLTRNAPGIGSYSSLWLGADHLLMVTSTGYSEQYSRVQLRDIKAFFVTEGNQRLWWAFFLSILAAIPAIVLINALIRHQRPLVSAIFLVLLLGALVWNALLGPGCSTYVVTGVQVARLPALGRRKQARRVIARLQPMILASQSDLLGAPAAEPLTPPPPA